MDREHYMDIALGLAREALNTGDIPVGCVIAGPEGEIIGRGCNRREAKQSAVAHAEIEAIGAACAALGSWRLDGCALYVTLEPCPMCAGAIINARIPVVVFGAKQERTGSCGSVINLFEEGFGHRPAVYGGVREAESRRLLEDFFKRLR